MGSSPTSPDDLQQILMPDAEPIDWHGDLTSAAEERERPAEVEAAESVGVLAVGYYRHNSVTAEVGTRPIGPSGPLRASQVRVWAEDIKWNYAAAGNSAILLPTGQGGTADNSYVYPGLPIFGIVLYQPPNGSRFSVTGSSRDTAQIFAISNGLDIRVAVNDTRGNYRDNWGAFDFRIEVLQP